MDKKIVLIGIQARITSSRLPRKIFEKIGKKDMLQHVIDQANNCASFLNKYSDSSGIEVITALLIPEGQDEIYDRYGSFIDVYEGPEEDVLARFSGAMTSYDADWIVRLTGDCPRLKAKLISYHIDKATRYQGFDYVENIDPALRTFADGLDVEVLSRGAVHWLANYAKTDSDREHVTTALIRERPAELTYAHVQNYHDASATKLSVDTAADLARVQKETDTMYRKRYARVNIMVFQI
jgi:spore coat polysaccharide biosynthesis protein SpsF